jgi:carbon-monoxide dehydrogenase medium subunit
VTSARTAYISVSPVPVVVDVTAAAPSQALTDAPSWAGAGESALTRLDPEGDIHATVAYRSHLARVLTARALAQATSVALASLEAAA